MEPLRSLKVNKTDVSIFLREYTLAITEAGLGGSSGGGGSGGSESSSSKQLLATLLMDNEVNNYAFPSSL